MISITFLIVQQISPRRKGFDVEISASDSFEVVAKEILSSCNNEKEQDLRVLIFGSVERVLALLNRFEHVDSLLVYHSISSKVIPTTPSPSDELLIAHGRYTMGVYTMDLEEYLHESESF